MFGGARDPGLKKEALALHAGVPVRESWLPYGHHSIDEEDIAAVVEVLRSDWITQGPRVAEFERTVADYCGARFGIAFSSGTAALHAACVAAGLGPGDEAITSPLTFVATANSVVYCGARPVFADICEDTLNIDPREIERQITSRTKVVLPVDFGGLPVDLDAILSLAAKHQLTVIEDASHALGAEYRSKKIGGIAHMTVFSFHPVKHVTTGEGGMVLTDDEALADRLRRLRHHSIRQLHSQRPWRYEISDLGYNYRLSDIHCALGIRQMEKLDERLAKRRAIAGHYRKVFCEFEQVSLPSVADDVKHAWHLFTVLLNQAKLSADRDLFLEALRAENIGATLHYPVVHLHDFYRKMFGYKEGDCPIAEATSDRMVTLPLFSAMTHEDVDDVAEAVVKVLQHYSA